MSQYSSFLFDLQDFIPCWTILVLHPLVLLPLLKLSIILQKILGFLIEGKDDLLVLQVNNPSTSLLFLLSFYFSKGNSLYWKQSFYLQGKVCVNTILSKFHYVGLHLLLLLVVISKSSGLVEKLYRANKVN